MELILAFATVILALITGWMAWETRRTAATATKALELEQMPILGVRGLRVEVVSIDQVRIASVVIGMELFNAGRVPVRYKVKSFSVRFANHYASTGEFLSRGGRVLPGASTTFFHSGLPLDPPVSTFPAKGRVCFEYEYSDESGRQQRPMVETIEYTLAGPAPGAPVTWRNVDEPSAS